MIMSIWSINNPCIPFQSTTEPPSMIGHASKRSTLKWLSLKKNKEVKNRRLVARVNIDRYSSIIATNFIAQTHSLPTWTWNHCCAFPRFTSLSHKTICCTWNWIPKNYRNVFLKWLKLKKQMRRLIHQKISPLMEIVIRGAKAQKSLKKDPSTMSKLTKLTQCNHPSNIACMEEIKVASDT